MRLTPLSPRGRGVNVVSIYYMDVELEGTAHSTSGETQTTPTVCIYPLGTRQVSGSIYPILSNSATPTLPLHLVRSYCIVEGMSLRSHE